jgi:hypothetical protein
VTRPPPGQTPPAGPAAPATSAPPLVVPGLPPLDLLIAEPDLRLAAGGGLVLFLLSGRFHVGMIQAVNEAQLAAPGPLKNGVLAVVRESTLRAGSSLGRSDLDVARAALAQLAPRVAALAVVIEGRGLLPSIARAFASGGALLDAGGYPARVFADVAAAAPWLAQRLASAPSVPPRPTLASPALVLALEALARLPDP